jgi:serine/threonine-protein kinase RsbW
MPSPNQSVPDPSTDSAPADRIDVVVPVRTEFASTVRTVAASLGADAGFSIDEIDDVRLALSEVFAAFADSPGLIGGRLRVSFISSEGRLDVTTSPEHGASDVEFDELASSILQTVVDEFATGRDGVRIVKQAVEIVGASPKGAENMDGGTV